MSGLNFFWFRDLVGLLFPRICHACGKPLNSEEEMLCTSCSYLLPRTHFHNHKDNPVREVFGGILPIQAATSLLFFNKGGMAQTLIHKLKYDGKTQIGIYLGRLLGQQLMNSPLFRDADLLLPVPLHPAKLKTRGYNQSEIIASGMASVMDAAVNPDVLVRSIHTSSQTRKSRYARWENVKDIFEVKNASSVEGKHIILVDDVITTGATLEACAETLLSVPRIKISVASLAYTQV